MEINSDKPLRTTEEVKESLLLAKLNENDVSSTAQILYFNSENIYNSNCKFLELDKHLLETLQNGQTIYIAGDDNEDAVICTDKYTYDVSEAETSNSLLLVDGLKFNNDLQSNSVLNIHKVNILGTFFNYLEVTLGKPHLKKLSDLLENSLYKGPEYEDLINKNELFCFDDLVNCIQASSSEIKEALSTMNVVKIDNKIRLLDFEYHFRVLSYMLRLIDENSWQLDEIDYDETVNSLSDLVPAEILNNLFETYTEPSKVFDGVQLYKYNETKTCRFLAKVLLHEAGRFNLTEFLQAWQESVPEGMTTNEEMLYGIALINRNCSPSVIWAYPEEKLPENINERFKILFETKDKWTAPEISPYIKRLTTPKLDVNALLSKYTRSSTINGIKYYSSKHTK